MARNGASGGDALRAHVGPQLHPFLHGPAGNDLDVVARLAGQLAATMEPVLHPAGSGIVGCRSQSQIAELLAQLLEPPRRVTQRLAGLEWIGKSARACRLRHELCDPPRTLRADRTRIEAAFLPDQPREELGR